MYFLVVKPYTAAKERYFPSDPAGTPADVALLEEIRDLLRTQAGAAAPPAAPRSERLTAPAHPWCGGHLASQPLVVAARLVLLAVGQVEVVGGLARQLLTEHLGEPAASPAALLRRQLVGVGLLRRGHG